MNKLTIIIPIRAMSNRDIADRLIFCISDPFLDRKEIDFIVVDDGSDSLSKAKHKIVCKHNSIEYIYINSSDKPVNMARARNRGVAQAKGKYIMFMDVDLHPYPGYYTDILNEIMLQDLESNSDDLIMTSVIYLTQQRGNELFFNTDEEKRKTLFLEKLKVSDSSVIEKFSMGTSVTLYHKSRYLELGGYDEDFYEWGYEDLEFNLRMICASNKFAVPDDFHLDYKTFQTIDEYRGWKSLYKRYGEMTFSRDIILFHIWHDVDKGSNYIEGYERNRQLFVKKISKLCLNSKKTSKIVPLYIRYKNSFLITFVQSLKKIPFIGSMLLYIKHKVFRWN